MTDKEIIKALEWLIFNFPKVKGPKTDSDKLCNCINLYCKNALDLINRKNEEIENLNIELKAMRCAANSYKAEVERLRKGIKNLLNELTEKGTSVSLVDGHIDG